MTWCELDDMDDAFCEHGRLEERRAAAAARQARIALATLRISPRGMAHFEGCPHKGDDPDLSEWATLDTPHAWARLGNHERIQATGGERPEIVATSRCSDCLAHHGPRV